MNFFLVRFLSLYFHSCRCPTVSRAAFVGGQWSDATCRLHYPGSSLLVNRDVFKVCVLCIALCRHLMRPDKARPLCWKYKLDVWLVGRKPDMPSARLVMPPSARIKGCDHHSTWFQFSLFSSAHTDIVLLIWVTFNPYATYICWSVPL